LRLLLRKTKELKKVSGKHFPETEVQWNPEGSYIVFINSADGSVRDADGKLLFFSLEAFLRDIAGGDRCFICGLSPHETRFNNEHVLPDWIVRKYQLHNRVVTLPNGTQLCYDQWKIPCCENCNSLMGTVLENPVRNGMGQGLGIAKEALAQDGSWPVFIWLSLILLKTHLKGRELRLNRDLREPDDRIADLFDWATLHHIHCVARAFYTRASLDATALGSLLVLQAKTADHLELFDYADIHFAKTILLRLDDVAFIAVLDDSCAVLNALQPLIEKFTAPLSPIQLRELMARFAIANLSLKERPKFTSEFDPQTGLYLISTKRPDYWELNEPDAEMYGSILHRATSDYLRGMPAEWHQEMDPHIRRGEFTFLFDPNGDFDATSMNLAP
jgi:hypothetical protein